MSSPFLPGLQQSCLCAGSALRWRFDRATVVSVQRGRLWITLDGRPDDWFLDPGMALRVAPRHGMVLEAAGRPGEPVVLTVAAEPVPLAGWPGGMRRRTAAGDKTTIGAPA